jgi:hypothetical protein
MALLLLALPTAAFAGENTLADFGYYYAMEMPPDTIGREAMSSSVVAAATGGAAVGVLTTLCTQPGEPNSTITVSYTDVAGGSKASDYIGLWCPTGSNATYVSRSALASCQNGGGGGTPPCSHNGSVSFSPAMLAVAGRMQRRIGGCEFRYCRNNDSLCGPAKPANFVARSGSVAVGSCCPPPPAVASLPPVVAAHSTTTFVDTSSFPGPGPFPGQLQSAAALAAANISVVISGLDSIFLDPANTTMLDKNWQQQWSKYWATISPHAR